LYFFSRRKNVERQALNLLLTWTAKYEENENRREPNLSETDWLVLIEGQRLLKHAFPVHDPTVAQSIGQKPWAFRSCFQVWRTWLERDKERGEETFRMAKLFNFVTASTSLEFKRKRLVQRDSSANLQTLVATTS